MRFSTSQLHSTRAQPPAKQYTRTLQEQTLQRLISSQNRYVLEPSKTAVPQQENSSFLSQLQLARAALEDTAHASTSWRGSLGTSEGHGLMWIAPYRSLPLLLSILLAPVRMWFWKSVFYSQHSWLKNKPQKRLVFPFKKKCQEKEAQRRNATSIKILIIYYTEVGKAVCWLVSTTIWSGFRSCSLNYYLS